MSQAHAARATECHNCGESLRLERPPNYCPECGQQTTLHPPSVWEFVHEFIGHYVALEGKLWKTLALLLFRPGRLTSEYLAGRRERYVLPLRLYLSASFVFFVLVKLVGPAVVAHDATAMLPPPRLAASGGAAQLCDEAGAFCQTINRWFGSAVLRWRENPQQAQAQLRSRFASNVPYAMFALLPIFAGLVQLAYRKRRMLYGEHLVFGMHVHAFAFIALLALAWLPTSAADIVWLAIPLYGLIALRRVYGGSWGGTLLRALFIGLIYFVLLSVALAVGVAYLFATTA